MLTLARFGLTPAFETESTKRKGGGELFENISSALLFQRGASKSVIRCDQILNGFHLFLDIDAGRCRSDGIGIMVRRAQPVPL